MHWLLRNALRLAAPILFIASIPGPAELPVSANTPAGRASLMYYVPYDARSADSFAAHAPSIDYLAAQWVTIDACGQVGASDDLTIRAIAANAGTKVLPTLATFSGVLKHELLTVPMTTKNALDQIAGYVTDGGYDGFDLDLEAVAATDREALSQFVERLGDVLHANGKMLTLALPAKAKDFTTGWAGAYDYARLGKAADLITIMTYEYSGAWGNAGPVAPYGWVRDVIRFASSQIPSEKVVRGLAFYGCDWNTTSGGTRSVGFQDAAILSERYQAPIDLDPETKSATFRFQAVTWSVPATGQMRPPADHVISVRKAGSCGVVLPTPLPISSSRPAPKPGAVQEHVVLIEEARSATERLALVDQFGLAGVGAWRLGQEDPAFWPVLTDWRSVR